MSNLLHPEQQLLLDSARREVTPDAAERMRASLAALPDWTAFQELAEYHRVVPLVSRSLSQFVHEGVPADALQALNKRAQELGLWNLTYTAKLLEILAALEQHKIPALPLKGPALAVQVYGDLSLRSFGDLDILIREQDFPRAIAVLVGLGYHPSRPLHGPRELAAYPRRYHDYKLHGSEDTLMVELQWKVIQFPFAFPPDVEGWWSQLQTMRLGGREVRTLDLESLLLILCVHGSKHLWERLNWLCDVAELVRGAPQLDWNRLLVMARRRGAARMLRLGLALAHELLGAPLPATVVTAITADPQVAVLSRQVIEVIFPAELPATESPTKRPLFYLAMLERRRDRLRMALRHSHSLLEPGRLFRTYGIEPIRRLAGRC